MPEVIQLLQDWGVTVDTLYPEEQIIDLAQVRVEHDLYVLKSGTDLALSLAGALHANGATILNPYPISEILRDKIISTRVLQAAGIPTPDTFVTGQPKQLAPLLKRGPLVVKPYRGSEGRGVQVVHSVNELADITTNEDLVFAQRFHEPDGRDRKIYVIGGQVFGVMRVWPARTYEQKIGEPFTITPEIHEIALRCGRAFGLEVYGLDIVESDGRPYVVDVSSFPGFKGVPDAALRLADYIYTTGQRVMSGAPLMPMFEKEFAL
jgi:ribosomal protein S6--L-glutamate ligase